MPELPDARRKRFISSGISTEHAKTLTGGLKLAEFYESVAREDLVLRDMDSELSSWSPITVTFP